MEPQKHLEDFGEQCPTINKMHSEGPGLSQVSSHYIKFCSDHSVSSHIDHFFEKLFSLSLQIAIILIVASVDSIHPQICNVSSGGSAFVINLTDGKLLGLQCNTKFSGKYKAEQVPNS